MYPRDICLHYLRAILQLKISEGIVDRNIFFLFSHIAKMPEDEI